ncbi:hypothetical protein [Pseudactinotalea terrae]|uniref:hypothetical protein n=1 Tax=Pseudactinotalea terrae TaxID=1743262 RepID=UPI0012E1AE0B|nr:hypothetical protein [Pseudactinotalea terrae]
MSALSPTAQERADARMGALARMLTTWAQESQARRDALWGALKVGDRFENRGRGYTVLEVDLEHTSVVIRWDDDGTTQQVHRDPSSGRRREGQAADGGRGIGLR